MSNDRYTGPITVEVDAAGRTVASREVATVAEALRVAEELGRRYPDYNVHAYRADEVDYSTDYGYVDGLEDDEREEVELAARKGSASRPTYDRALEIVNRHRQSLGMPRLDPGAKGWYREDVRREAERIQRTTNPPGHPVASNPVTIHEKSHVDHGVSPEQMNWVLDQFRDCDGFFIDTVTLPPELGTAPSGLHPDVPESDVFYARRGERPYESRMTRRPPHQVREVTVIAGPHEDDPCILYTMYGGSAAPKEPGDPTLEPEERAHSEAFWSRAALASLEANPIANLKASLMPPA